MRKGELIFSPEEEGDRWWRVLKLLDTRSLGRAGRPVKTSLLGAIILAVREVKGAGHVFSSDRNKPFVHEVQKSLEVVNRFSTEYGIA